MILLVTTERSKFSLCLLLITFANAFSPGQLISHNDRAAFRDPQIRTEEDEEEAGEEEEEAACSGGTDGAVRVTEPGRDSAPFSWMSCGHEP